MQLHRVGAVVDRDGEHQATLILGHRADVAPVSAVQPGIRGVADRSGVRLGQLVRRVGGRDERVAVVRAVRRPRVAVSAGVERVVGARLEQDRSRFEVVQHVSFVLVIVVVTV